tara:strand:+ start:382 stop:1938 length:1557 start_codon:yes stop_codon:yes gene_type:complete
MSATLEVKYYNSFWLKKIKTITDVTSGATAIFASQSASFPYNITITVAKTIQELNVGQEVSWLDTGVKKIAYINAIASPTGPNTVFTPSSNQTIPAGATLTFGPITSFNRIPVAYASNNTNDWYIEEARIRGGFNNTSIDLGVKAYLVEDNINSQIRFNSLIYSGIYNSRTGVNNTNQFSVADDITKSADPANASIQKLYAEDTNLIIFQEDKVSRALIDKDAIYSAEGSASITSTALVIGQIIAYAGEYGISTDPFSFAVYGNRKYFTDRKRNCVLRLSSGTGGGNGITEISSYGMHDFFRDELSNDQVTKIRGGWDIHTKNYVLSIQQNNSYKTVSFDEGVLGWTSFVSFKPLFMESLGSNFFSFFDIDVYQHYGTSSYGKFYGVGYGSDVTIIFNDQPSLIKNFKTINYEGSLGWSAKEILASSGDTANNISSYSVPLSLAALETSLFSHTFKRKENKFFANLVNVSTITAGEVLFGKQVSGLKGFFCTVKFDINSPADKKELFAVSSNTVESSY